MICAGCGKKAYWAKTYYSDGTRHEICNMCSKDLMHTTIPDVYWPGHAHTNDNLTDGMGNPILLTSKRHKASVMRDLGVIECGDRIGGKR